MFGLSGFEVAIIILFGFLIFGPDKLPQIARTIGRGVRQFRSAQEQMTNVIKAEVYDPIKDLEPLVNPFAGFSLDDIGGDTKKDADKKPSAKKAEDKSKASKTEDEKLLKSDESAADAAKGGEQEPKISSRDVKAAISEEAEKAKKKVLREAAEKTTNSGANTESFAERRARLEREHAKAKAEKAALESAGAASVVEAGVEAGAGAAGAASATAAGAGAAGAGAQVTPSEERKGDEKGN